MQIEGKNQVKQALLANTTINRLLVDKNFASRKDEILSLASKNKIKVEFLPKNLLDKKSQTGHHQGYIAEAVEFEYSSLDEILHFAQDKNQKPFVVLLDGVEDPHNFGAIIRSCECAGVHGIVICKNRACQVNETVIRTSAGAIANMKIARVGNLKEAIDQLKKQNVWVYGAEAGGDMIYSKNLSDRAIAVVIGSEGDGIKPSIKSYCDDIISLPLKGQVNSLNASVACGIIVFEILRQKEGKNQ